MKRTVWFDMDGTVYNLYGVNNWLERIEAKDASVFAVAGKERKTINLIRKAIHILQVNNIEVGVITWTPKHVTRQDKFFHEVELVKREWIARFLPEIPQAMIHVVEYGTPKREVAKSHDDNDEHVLVDDDKMVRKAFRSKGYKTINAKRGYIKQLLTLIE